MMNEKPRKKNVKLNYIYNVIYQILALLIPLISTPYISRVLGADGIGIYGYITSLETYFTLAASLGFGYYAQREIAKFQDDKLAQSKVFWEILIARGISCLITLFVYIILLFYKTYGQYNDAMAILSIQVVATLFDVTFFFQGNEEFFKIVSRNIVIKVLALASVFIFVKTKQDLNLYILINSLALLGSNLSLWPFLRKMLVKVPIKTLSIKRHIVPTLKLFIPTIALSIYKVLDKTLIGLLVPGTVDSTSTEIVNGIETSVSTTIRVADLENGYYEQADKLVRLCLGVITALGTVMSPRNSNLFEEGKEELVIENIQKSCRFVFFLGIPIMLGLCGTASNVVPWFFGDGYDKVIDLIYLFSPLVLIIGLSNVFGLQYLIPKGKDNQFTISIVVGALVNLTFNFILIPKYYSYGAVIGSVIAEGAILVTQMIFMRKEIKAFPILKTIWKYVIGGMIMFGIVYYLGNFVFKSSILFSICLIFIGILIYFLVLLLLKDSLLYNYISLLRNKRKKSS